MEDSRRAQYRVPVDEADGLNVTVRKPGGSVAAGRLVDVSASGAGVEFAAAGAPELVVGQVADLVFTGEGLKNPLTVAATVQHRTEETESRRYGFRFLQAQQLETLLPPAFHHYFNRRRTQRVTPDPNEPVRVTMEVPVSLGLVDDDLPLEARLEDLSIGGAAVTLEAELDIRFANTTEVKLSMMLPDSRVLLELVGNIRHRRLVGRTVRYGIQFNPKGSPNFDRQRDAIGRYVARRERQELKKSA